MVELVCSPAADELTVSVEIDRRGGLLSELADADGRKTAFTVGETDRAVSVDGRRTSSNGTPDRRVGR